MEMDKNTNADIYFLLPCSDSLCINCVKENCRRIRFEARLVEDHKFVTDALKCQSTDR